jgi:hypothetical protein
VRNCDFDIVGEIEIDVLKVYSDKTRSLIHDLLIIFLFRLIEEQLRFFSNGEKYEIFKFL